MNQKVFKVFNIIYIIKMSIGESDAKYLAKFNTEEELDNEIERLYKVIKREIPVLTEDIDFFKNARVRGMEKVEIEPSIIDKLQESHTQTQDDNCDLSTLPGYINHTYKNISGWYKEDNFCLKVYAIYRHRKHLEKKYKELLNGLNQDFGTNFDETNFDTMIVKEKIILLYKKSVEML